MEGGGGIKKNEFLGNQTEICLTEIILDIIYVSNSCMSLRSGLVVLKSSNFEPNRYMSGRTGIIERKMKRYHLPQLMEVLSQTLLLGLHLGVTHAVNQAIKEVANSFCGEQQESAFRGNYPGCHVIKINL